MIPQNNSLEEMLVYSDWLIDNNQQSESDQIKQELKTTNFHSWEYQSLYNIGGGVSAVVGVGTVVGGRGVGVSVGGIGIGVGGAVGGCGSKVGGGGSKVGGRGSIGVGAVRI